jgi:O-antigen/teichoic acid export membrane protein
MFPGLSFNQLLVLITGVQVLRTLSICIFFRRELLSGNGKFDVTILVRSFPFAMLAFTGFLSTKADMLYVIAALTQEDKAFYQIYTSFLVLIQTLSNFIFLPFAGNFYRFNEQQYNKTRWLFMGLGLLCCSAGLPVTFLVMHFGYHLEPSWIVLAAGFLYAFAPFVSLPSVYGLFKSHHTHWVIYINLAGVALLVALYTAAFASFGKSITVAIVAATVHQLLVALGFYLAANKLVKHDADATTAYPPQQA